MDRGGLKDEAEPSSELWVRARPDRRPERNLERDMRAPKRQERKTRTGGRS